MSKRMDICTPRKGKDDKTWWSRIGTAWFNDNGGIQLVFDALPLSDNEGRCVANLFDPKPREAQGFAPQGRGTAMPADLDDEIPGF